MNKTKKTGLVGYPIEHSLSPVMLNIVYEYYDLDWSYQLYPAEDNAEFHSLFSQIQDSTNGFIGLNVTMPYKSEAAQALLVSNGKLIGAAQKISAVNVLSLLFDNQKHLQRQMDSSFGPSSFYGYNLDGDGLVASLLSRTNLNLQGSAVLIAGTGAVTAASCLALAKAQVSSITVVSRHRQRAIDFIDSLSQHLQEQQPRLLAKGIGYQEVLALQAEVHKANLIIDATPIGMYSDDLALLPVELLSSQHTVLDVVYGHGQTQLIKAARAAGATALDGLGMLVEQAALTFETWVADQELRLQIDHHKITDLMSKAALAELQRRELLG